jgi:hypothetical protein
VVQGDKAAGPQVPIGYVPDVVAGLPAHGIAVRTYVTCMFEYGKGYSGAGTDTLSERRVVRPHAIENEETGPGHRQNFIHPVFRHGCHDGASCAAAEALPFHLGEDIHTSYLRPKFDVEPLSRYLRRARVLPGDAAPAAPATKPRARARAAEEPPSLTAHAAESPCATSEVELYADTCVAAGPDATVPANGSHFQYLGSVPVLSRHAGAKLARLHPAPWKPKEVLPWLADYVLSREGEWRGLQRAADAGGDDPTLMARRQHFNVLSSGRTKSERERLAAVGGFVSAALLELMEKWQGSAAGGAAGTAAMALWRPFVKGHGWGKIPEVVAECWPTIDRASPGSKWEQYSYEPPYDHPYPFQAELHLTAAPGAPPLPPSSCPSCNHFFASPACSWRAIASSLWRNCRIAATAESL